MVRLHGWDPDTRSWYGPVEIAGRSRATDFQKLRASDSGYSGTLSCPLGGFPDVTFATVIHDLEDCAVATLGTEDSCGFVLAVLLVLPARRRTHVRADLAFEFASFLRFFRIIDAGDELPIHDYIEAVVVTEDPRGSVAFSITRKSVDAETAALLAYHFETLAEVLVRWQERKGTPRHETGRV
jgi:hypothetical protein